MHKKRFLILLSIALIVFIFALWVNVNGGNQPDYPSDGAYYCAELDMRLTFSGRQITANFSNSEDIIVHASWGNGFISLETEYQFRANYHWNHWKNHLTLTFKWSSFDCTPDVKYVFKHIE